ncbi:MAG: hypothetical protein AAFW81_01945 [Pseudomonadota bacterium]
MAQTAGTLSTLDAKARFAARRLHAWWEGYRFDPMAERAVIQAKLAQNGQPGGRPVDAIVAEAIWGAGRLEPGSPDWSMRLANKLALPHKSRVIVFGAGAGASVDDLATGAGWKVIGLTPSQSAANDRVVSYDLAMQRVQKSSADGALCLYQLSRDSNPTAFAEFAADLTTPGAPVIFADYVVARRWAKLPSCFPGGSGFPKTEREYGASLAAAGFEVESIGDDSEIFRRLIADGWAGWRRAYDAFTHIDDTRLRAEMLRAMASQASYWAERNDAIKSGHLGVRILRARKR